MLNRLIERLFPGRLLARRERQWWLAAILLAPAAMLPGLFTGPPAIFGGITHVEHDRAGFLNIARKHLAERGVNTEGWKDTLRFVEDVDVERYLANRDAQWQARLRKHAPPIVALASFQPRSGGGSADVHLDIHGKPAGFALVQVTAQGVSASAQGTPVEVARAALAARLGADLPLFRLGEPEVTLVGREGGIPTQRFVWKTVPPGMAELEVRFRVDVRGATVLAELGELKLDAQYAAAHRPGRTFQTAIGWFFVFYATVLIIAVLVRYIKRSLQKEISHPRTIGIAFFFGATFFLYAAASDQLLAIRDTGGAPIAIIYLLAAIIYLIMGLLIGSAYSASEGELRESYPGKLTSLDSVLSGRPFSRNAAASFLLGVVIAAWMILFHEALRWTMPTPANFGGGEMLGLFVYSRFPSLVSFATLPIGAIMESLTLLLPIALLQRFFKSRRTLLCVVTPLALAASVGFTLAQASQSGLPLGATIAQALVKTAGLFAAFFWVDLFAAIVSHSVHSLIVFLLPVVRITPSGANEALLQLAVALLVLLAYAVALFRSRPVRDEEVRPQYARFLAERLSLESEVAAAREAQLRLLPTEPPRIEGLAIAAICRAADEVGGDFYDFFKLSPHRLALLVSDGGGRGLATALSIAVAKGYLMEKAQAAQDPVTTLCSLRAALGGLVDSRGGFCFAVIDTAERTLRYARTGETPKVLLEAGASVFESPSKADPEVIEGSAHLALETRFVFYTDGLGARLATSGSGAADRWLQQVFAWHKSATAETLGQTLVQELFSSLKGGRSARLEDDLTLLVLRIEGPGASRREQVA